MNVSHLPFQKKRIGCPALMYRGIPLASTRDKSVVPLPRSPIPWRKIISGYFTEGSTL
jgi:hypothetical protein